MDSSRIQRFGTSEEILEYLESPLLIDPTHCEEVEDLKAQLRNLKNAPLEVDVSQLNLLRLKSSNTLHHGKEVEAWNQANAFLFSKLEQTLSVELIQSLNGILFGQTCSEFRSTPCYGANQEYLGAEFVPTAVASLVARINACTDPLERAFLFTEGLLTIHPFADGNGRTSRLIGDFLLLQEDYLPQIYLNPVLSHMALTINGPHRDRTTSYLKFLRAVQRSYKLA